MDIKTAAGKKQGLTPDDIAGRLFSFHDRAHFFHLQTLSFAQHKMLDELYKDLVESKDTICEFLLGVQAPKRFGGITIEQPGEFSAEAINTFLQDGFDFSMQLCSYAEDNNLEELCNLASDLQELFTKAKYLNTLT